MTVVFARNQTAKRSVVAMCVAAIRFRQFRCRKPSQIIHPRSDCEGHGRPRRRDNLHERFEVKKINHQEAYGLDRAYAEMAEQHFCRLRRAEIDIDSDAAGYLEWGIHPRCHTRFGSTKRIVGVTLLSITLIVTVWQTAVRAERRSLGNAVCRAA